MSGVPDYTLEDTLDFKFTTRQFTTGAPFAFASGAIEIYEDNSVAQITGAETLTLEFDGVTGLHNLRVAATAVNGFENGKSYQCVVSAGTVDSVSVVGEVVQQFSIGRSAAAVDLANGTDGLGAIKTDTGEIGTAGAGLTNINLPNQTMDIIGDITGNLSGSVGSVTGAVGSVTGAVGSVTGSVGSVVASVTIDAASVDAIWDETMTAHATADSAAVHLKDILADTGELQADWTNAGRLDTILDTVAADVANIDGAAMRGTDSAATATAMATAQADLDTITGAAGALLDSTATSAQLVDDVWDEVLTKGSHDVSQSAGKRLREFSSSVIRVDTAQGPGTGNNQIQLDASASATDGAYDPALVSIVSGTGMGQTRLILEYDGTSKTATVDRNWKVNPDATSEFVISADAGRNHVNEGLAQAGGANTITLNVLASSGDDVYVGQICFIRSGTGEDQAGLIIAYNGTTKVATIDRNWVVNPDTTSGYTMIPSSPILLAATTHTNAVIPTVTDVTTKTGYSADMTAISGSTTAADNLQRGAEALVLGAAVGTPTTTVIDTDLSETTDDHYVGRIVTFTTGNIAGQSSDITAYNGTTKELTVTALTDAPSATDVFVIS